jgi:hypothetical protein
MIESKDKKFIDKVIGLFTDNFDKVYIMTDKEKSLSLPIFKPIDEATILDSADPILSYEVYMVIDEYKVTLLVLENMMASRGTWMKVTEPVEILIHAIDESKIYNQLVTVYDNAIKFRDNEKQKKYDLVMNEFLMDQLTFDDPIPKIVKAIEKKTRSSVKKTNTVMGEPAIMDFSRGSE